MALCVFLLIGAEHGLQVGWELEYFLMAIPLRSKESSCISGNMGNEGMAMMLTWSDTAFVLGGCVNKIRILNKEYSWFF